MLFWLRLPQSSRFYPRIVIPTPGPRPTSRRCACSTILQQHKDFSTDRIRHAKSDLALPARPFEFGDASPTERKRQAAKPTSVTRLVERSQGPTRDDIPEKWMRKLEPFLPTRLRLDNETHENQNTDPVALVHILQQSQEPLQSYFGEPLDLFTYVLVSDGRYEAILDLVNQLLQFTAGNTANTSQQNLPSNLLWPPLRGSLDAFEISTVRRSSLTSPSGLTASYESQPSTENVQAALAHVWHFLGTTVILSANSNADDAKALLTVVRRALARIHHLNLIPNDIYSYAPLCYSSNVQRPPILHLLSSRILTTLSDVVWRSQQDEAISEAVNAGVPYHELGRDPPGGRFRLKVRDIGPEAWLEFILWCCVEGGFDATAVKVITLIKNQTERPWFAANWTNSTSAANIDWKRVKARTGGVVGRVEGYSGEDALVNIPARTISVEVVLALVESLITNSISRKDEKLLLGNRICVLIGFLEPHSLPTEYIHYLAARLLDLQAEAVVSTPDLRRSWCTAIEWLRNLDSTNETAQPTADFRYQSVINHGEILTGQLHQHLQSCLAAGYPGEAVDTFDGIQKLVDGSKIEAIKSFINTPVEPFQSLFSSRPSKKNPDFMDSHGQLPQHKIAGFLNMVTENRLVGLGDWLLYSTDVDGPLIPRRAFGHPTMSIALIRYASRSQDLLLMNLVLADTERRRLKPSVTYLRTVVSACVRNHNYSQAQKHLVELSQAIGGGFSPDNLANLGAVILAFESRLNPTAGVIQGKATASQMMEDMLNGKYNESSGSYMDKQNIVYRQQIGHLLRLFDNISSPSLNAFAGRYLGAFPARNDANLNPTTFGIILRSVVSHHGVFEGRRLWEVFCQSPRVDTVVTGEHHARIGDASLPTSGESQTFLQIPGKENRPFTSDISFETDHFANPYLTASEPSARNALVLPTIKNLRIISRGALIARSKNSDPEHRAKLTDVLYWAGEQFRAFGRSEDAIRREIELSSSETRDEQLVSGSTTLMHARERRPIDAGTYFRGRDTTRSPSWARVGEKRNRWRPVLSEERRRDMAEVETTRPEFG